MEALAAPDFCVMQADIVNTLKAKMENPKLFVSYSWSSPEHEDWVLTLAAELRENGVDITLDKWDLKEGHDANAFMEKMVTDPEIKKVILVCDKIYAEKADKRKGGVGTEAQIISGEIYAKVDQDKFVAVLAERDGEGNACLPTYYKSRIYVDLSDNDLYAKNFEQLLRWVYDKPFFIKPELGKAPSFLEGSESAISLGTTSRFKTCLDAIRHGKSYASGATNEYLDIFVQNLERYRITDKEGKEFDDLVIENIENLIPYRNEAIEVFLALSQYRANPETYSIMHRFFEQLIPYMDRPAGINQWQEWDFDNFQFIANELFLYCISSLLKYECFEGVKNLLGQGYFSVSDRNGSGSKMKNFCEFSQHLRSLEHRNKRLNLRRLSLYADLLSERSKASGFNFEQIMQADFLIFLKNSFDCLKEEFYQDWWPNTLLYARNYGAFEIFARAESKTYFERIKNVLNIQSKDDFALLMQAFKEGKLHVPKWEFNSVPVISLCNFEKLASKP